MTNEEAIEIFSKVKALPCGWCYEGGDEFRQALDLAIKALEDKSQGEWIVEKNKFGDILHCSICGARPRRSEYGYDLHDKFCNECGADMRKAEAKPKMSGKERFCSDVLCNQNHGGWCTSECSKK